MTVALAVVVVVLAMVAATGVARAATVYTFADTAGSSSSSDAPPTRLNGSYGAAFDAAGNVYVADAGIALADRWTDFSDSKWMMDYGVTATQAATVAAGYDDGTFKPALAVTRGQFAKMVVDGFGLGTPTPLTATFSDVPLTHYYFPWVEGGVYAGIISGYDDHTFRPETSISRHQTSSILGLLLSQKELALTGHIRGNLTTYASLSAWYAAEGPAILAAFADRTSLAFVHAPATAYLIMRGVAQGSSSGGATYLRPLSKLTRAQAVTMILRTRAVLPHADVTAPVGSIQANAGDQYTNNINVTLTLAATDAVGVAGYKLADGTDASMATEVPVTSATSYSGTASLDLPAGDGTKTVAVMYRDAAGNWSPNYTATIVLDQTAPVISAPADFSQETTTSHTGAVVTFSVSATDVLDSSPAVRVDPASGSMFPMGETTVNVTATDAAGNIATKSFKVTVVDRPSGMVSINAGAQYTNSINVTLSLAAQDAEGVTAYRMANGSDASGAATVTVTPATSYNGSSSFSLPIGDGTKTVAVQYRDALGTWSANSTDTIILDQTAPTITIPPDITTLATDPSGAIVTFSVSAIDALDPAPSCIPAPVSGSTFPVGTTTVRATAQDTAGNERQASFTVTVTSGVPVSFTVTASTSGGHGTITPDSVTVNSGASSGDFTMTPDTGYHLERLTDNGTDVTGNVVGGKYAIANVTAAHTLVGTWTATSYTITFDSDGGSDVASITQAFGSDVTAPDAPTKAGYSFAGWTPALPETMPLGGAALTATWTADPPKAITAFSFSGLSPAAPGIINESAHTITVTVPHGTVVTNMVPTITITGASVSPVSGVANDFSSSVIYTVTSTDASIQDYTVTVTVAPELAVGDFYGGGIVAYILLPGDPGYDASVQHGLIAAAEDLGLNEWSNIQDTAVTGTGTAIGTGQANTAAIVGQGGCTSGAAFDCNSLVEGGYSDWYLPSKDELNELYVNRDAIGGFAGWDYCCSSQVDANNAWIQTFSSGVQHNDGSKGLYRPARPVRSF